MSEAGRHTLRSRFPEAGSPGAEPREVTVLFSDLIGFRALADRLAIDETYAIVTGCLGLLDEIVRRHGAAVDKYLGDALMAVFGSPIPIEDAPRAALLAAIEMHDCVATYNREQRVDPPLALKTGINTGHALFGESSGNVLREFHVVGDCVNLAARLKAHADADQVLVGDATYEQVKSGFEFIPRRPFRFKGKSEALRYFELNTAKQPLTRSPPQSESASTTPVVGRTTERRVLAKALEELAAGRGGSLVLEGASGSGKTRLIEDALESLASTAFAIHRLRSPRVGSAHAHETIAELFRNWAGIARGDAARIALPRLRTALGSVLGEDAQGAIEPLAMLLGISSCSPRAFHSSQIEEAAVQTLCAMARRGAVVVVCEDLHWADVPSLEMLDTLVRRCAEERVLFVMTFEVTPGQRTFQPLEVVRGHADASLHLGALGADEARELVVSLLGDKAGDEELVAAIVARGGGNPAALVRAAFLTPAIRQELDAITRTERGNESERRRATVVFADLTGFTAMTERLPQRTVHELVDRCMTILDEVTRRHGGSVEKHLGDCALAFFGAPIAIEDAARAALNASIEMRDEIRAYGREQDLPATLDIHIGVETGLAVAGELQGSPLREFVMLGEAVSLASSLADDAPAGSIYVGPQCRDATSGAFSFDELDSALVDGSSTHGPAYELRSTRPQLYRPRLPSSLSSEIVGRERELELLREEVARLAAGTGGVASVWGDAGIGKTRVVRELLEGTESLGVTALAARSLSIGRTLAFHPFADLLRSWLRISDDLDESEVRERLDRELRRLLPDECDEIGPFLASLMGLRMPAADEAQLGSIQSESMQRRIVRGVTLLLQRLATERPLMLVFEDLHWADTSSIELLETLLYTTHESPILLVAAFRPGFPSTSGHILEAVRTRADLRHLELPLRPLAIEAVRRLVDNLFRGAAIPARVRRTILEKADGNPFYVEEIARSLLDRGAVELREGELHAVEDLEEVDIPGTIHEVVMSRIDRRPLRQRSLLQLASVVGQSFHVQVLGEVLEDKNAMKTDLRDLEDAGFLVPLDRFAGAELGFVHPLIQEVAYDTIVSDRRAALHGAVARAVEARLTENVPGYHGMLAYHYVQARDAERAEEFLFQAGDEAARVAASAEALHFFREALKLFYELHGEHGAPDKLRVLEQKIAAALHHRGQFIEAVDHYNRALTLRGIRVPRRNAEVVGRFVWNLGVVLLDLYLPLRLRRRKPATPEEREVVELMFDRAQAQTTTSPTRFLFDGMDNLSRLRRVDPASVPEAGRMYAGTVGIFAYGGVSFGTSRRFLALAEELVRNSDPGQRMMFHSMNFCHHLLEGDWSQQHEAPPSLVDDALSDGRLWESTTYLGLLTEKDIYQGRFERASENLEQMEKIWQLYQYDLAKSNVFYSTALLLMQLGRLRDASEAIQTYFEANDEDLLNVLAMGAKSKLQLQLGDLAGAETSLALGHRLAQRSRPVPPFHMSSLLRSQFLYDLIAFEASRAEGSHAEWGARRRARASGRRALRAAGKVAWRQTEALRMMGRYHWLDGRPKQALEWWARSLKTGRELGALPELARTYAELGERLAEGTEVRSLEGRDASAFREAAQELFAQLGIREDCEAGPGPVD